MACIFNPYRQNLGMQLVSVELVRIQQTGARRKSVPILWTDFHSYESLHADKWGCVLFATAAYWVACTGYKHHSLAFTIAVRQRVGYSRYIGRGIANGPSFHGYCWKGYCNVRRTFTRVPGGRLGWYYSLWMRKQTSRAALFVL